MAIAAVLAIATAVLMPPNQSEAAWTVGKPIVTFCGSPGNLTTAHAKLLADGGFNVARANLPQMDMAEKYGLRVMFYIGTAWLDGGVQQAKMDKLIDQFKASPPAYCYFIADEPSKPAFAKIAEAVKYVKERDPDHCSYINLLPLSSSEYETYIRDFSDTVHPEILSYDYYPFRESGDIRGYLNNLKMMRAEAKRTGVPFMHIAQACADSWASEVLRVPTEGELRYQVYCTAAFGAHGISWYNLTAPKGGYDKGGLLFPDGKPTPIYEALTPLNHQFVAIVEQLQSMQSIGVYIKGYQSSAMPPGMTQLPSNCPFDIAKVSNTLVYKNAEPVKGVLFGFFGADGSKVTDATFALVQNLDTSLSKTYTVTGTGNMSVFDATKGTWTPAGTDEVTVNLLPGGGVLLRRGN